MASEHIYSKSFKPVTLLKKDIEDLDELVSSRFNLTNGLSYKIILKNRIVHAQNIEELLSEKDLPERMTKIKIIAHDVDEEGLKISGSIYIYLGKYQNSISIDHEDEVKARGLFQILENFFKKRKAPYFFMNKIMNYSSFLSIPLVFIPIILSEEIPLLWKLVSIFCAFLLSFIGIVDYKKHIFDTSKIYLVNDPKKDSIYKKPEWISVFVGVLSIIVAFVIAIFF